MHSFTLFSYNIPNFDGYLIKNDLTTLALLDDVDRMKERLDRAVTNVHGSLAVVLAVVN